MEYLGSINQELPASCGKSHQPLCSYLSHSGVIQLFLQRKALIELCGQNLRESKLPVNLVEPEVTLKFSGLFSKHAGDLSLALLNIKSGVCVIFSTQTLLPVSTIVEVKSMKVGDFSNLGYRQLKIQLRSGQPHELNENSSTKAQPQVSGVLKSELELIRDNVRRAKVQILDMDRELAKLSWKLGSENPKGDPDLVRNIIGRCEDANESAREDQTDWTITFSDPVLFQDWVLLPMCVDGMAIEQKVSVHVISPRNQSFQVLKEGNKSGQWTIAIQASLIVGYSGQMQGCLHWKVDSGFHQQLFEIPRLKIPPIEKTKTALRVALPFLNCIQLGLVNRAGSDLKDTLQALGLDEISKNLFAESSNRYHGPAFVKLAHPSATQIEIFGTDLSLRLILRRFHEECSDNFVILPLSAWKCLQEGQKDIYKVNTRSLIQICRSISDMSPMETASHLQANQACTKQLDKDHFQLRQSTTQVKNNTFWVNVQHFDQVLSCIDALKITHEIE